METEKKFFTLVFEGDISKFDINPFKTQTPFGTPVAAGKGDAFAEIDRLTEELQYARDEIGEAYRDGSRAPPDTP